MEILETNEGKLDYLKRYTTNVVRSMFENVDKKGMKKLAKNLSNFNTPCLKDLELGYHWETNHRGLLDIDNGKEIVSFHGLINRFEWGCKNSSISTVKSTAGCAGDKTLLGIEHKRLTHYSDCKWDWLTVKGLFEDLLVAGVVTYIRSKIKDDKPVETQTLYDFHDQAVGEILQVFNKFYPPSVHTKTIEH